MLRGQYYVNVRLYTSYAMVTLKLRGKGYALTAYHVEHDETKHYFGIQTDSDYEVLNISKFYINYKTLVRRAQIRYKSEFL